MRWSTVVDWWWRRRRRRPGDGVAHSPIFVRTRDVRELALGADVVGQRVQCSRPAAPARLRHCGCRLPSPPTRRPRLRALLPAVFTVHHQLPYHILYWAVEDNICNGLAPASRACGADVHLIDAALLGRGGGQGWWAGVVSRGGGRMPARRVGRDGGNGLVGKAVLGMAAQLVWLLWWRRERFQDVIGWRWRPPWTMPPGAVRAFIHHALLLMENQTDLADLAMVGETEVYLPCRTCGPHDTACSAR